MASVAVGAAQTSDEDPAGGARVSEEDLRRLVAMLARGSSCLGGLPIGLRAELSQTLHLLERYLDGPAGPDARPGGAWNPGGRRT